MSSRRLCPVLVAFALVAAGCGVQGHPVTSETPQTTTARPHVAVLRVLPGSVRVGVDRDPGIYGPRRAAGRHALSA